MSAFVAGEAENDLAHFEVEADLLQWMKTIIVLELKQN